MNVFDGEVSLISELYRSLDGFWGVVGSFEAWGVVCSSFVDMLRGRCRTYSAIGARPSGFAKFPGKRLPIFLSAATWAPPQRCHSSQSGRSDVKLFMFTACYGMGHGHGGNTLPGRLLSRIRGVAAN